MSQKPVVQDIGPQPNSFDLETATKDNANYRTVAWSGKYLQVTLMSIEPGQSIGLEAHPDTDQFLRLDASKRGQYSPDSELHLLWDKYPMIPSNSQSSGIDREKWLTYFPNDPSIDGPDRTVDYLFYSPRIKRVEAKVRQEDTLRISNHLPVIARFLLPAAQ